MEQNHLAEPVEKPVYFIIQYQGETPRNKMFELLSSNLDFFFDINTEKWVLTSISDDSIVVLNDGETFTDIQGVSIREEPEEGADVPTGFTQFMFDFEV